MLSPESLQVLLAHLVRIRQKTTLLFEQFDLSTSAEKKTFFFFLFLFLPSTALPPLFPR